MYFYSLVSSNSFAVKTFFGGKEFATAKQSIDDAATRYKDSMGYLTITMTAELLHHDKDDKREKVLEWVWKGDYWKRHKNIRDRRVANTGKGFLESDAVKAWRTGTGSQSLICLGIRTSPSRH